MLNAISNRQKNKKSLERKKVWHFWDNIGYLRTSGAKTRIFPGLGPAPIDFSWSKTPKENKKLEILGAQKMLYYSIRYG